jgi:hypothetical protein
MTDNVLIQVLHRFHRITSPRESEVRF